MAEASRESGRRKSNVPSTPEAGFDSSVPLLDHHPPGNSTASLWTRPVESLCTFRIEHTREYGTRARKWGVSTPETRPKKKEHPKMDHNSANIFVLGCMRCLRVLWGKSLAATESLVNKKKNLIQNLSIWVKIWLRKSCKMATGKKATDTRTFVLFLFTPYYRQLIFLEIFWAIKFMNAQQKVMRKA